MALKTKKPRPPRFTCPKCQDGPYAGLGYFEPEENQGAAPCECLEKIRAWERSMKMGLPEIFQDAQVSNWEPITQDHLSIRSKVIDFVEGWNPLEPRGLLALGCVGSGKTHLTAAVMKALMGKHQLEGRYVSTEVLFRSLRSSFSDPGEGSESRMIRDLEEVDLLLLDDLGITGSDYKKSVLYQVINFRASNGRPILASSNLELEDLEDQIDLRSVSRLVQCCEIIHFPQIDHRRPDVVAQIKSARRQ